MLVRGGELPIFGCCIGDKFIYMAKVDVVISIAVAIALCSEVQICKDAVVCRYFDRLPAAE